MIYSSSFIALEYYFDKVYGRKNLEDLILRYSTLGLNDEVFEFVIEDDFLNNDIGLFKFIGKLGYLSSGEIYLNGSILVSYKFVDFNINYDKFSEDFVGNQYFNYSLNGVAPGLNGFTYDFNISDINVGFACDLSPYTKIHYDLSERIHYNIDFCGRQVELYEDDIKFHIGVTGDYNLDYVHMYLSDYLLLLKNNVSIKGCNVRVFYHPRDKFEDILKLFRLAGKMGEKSVLFVLNSFYLYKNDYRDLYYNLLKYDMRDSLVNLDIILKHGHYVSLFEDLYLKYKII